MTIVKKFHVFVLTSLFILVFTPVEQANASSPSPTVTVTTSPEAYSGRDAGIRVRVVSTSDVEKLCFKIDGSTNHLNLQAKVIFGDPQNIWPEYDFVDGCISDIWWNERTFDLNLRTWRNVSPGEHTLEVQYIEKSTMLPSNSASYQFSQNNSATLISSLLNISGGEKGSIEFSYAAEDDTYLSECGTYNRWHNSLLGVDVFENNQLFTGNIKVKDFQDSFGYGYDTSDCANKRIFIDDARSKFDFVNGRISVLDQPNFGRLNQSWFQIFPRGTAELKTYKFEVVSSDLHTERDGYKSFSVKWPDVNISAIESTTISGLVQGTAHKGRTVTVPNIPNVCTAWVPADSNGEISDQRYPDSWSTIVTGESFTPSTDDAKKYIAPVRFIENLEINGILTKTPCNPNRPGPRAPYFTGAKILMTDKVSIDWGGYATNGLNYGKTQSHSIRLVEKGFGLPNKVMFRQKVGSTAFSKWRSISVTGEIVRFTTSGKGNTTTEFQITDPSGTYTIGKLAQLKPTVSSSMAWKSKDYVSGLWQGGVLRVKVSVPKWYKGKVSAVVLTDHAYDFLGTDHGQYSRIAWYKAINGSLTFDIKVSFHGVYVYSLAFVGSQQFSYSPGTGHSFQ